MFRTRKLLAEGKRRSDLLPSTVLLTHALFAAEFIKFGVTVRGLLYIQLTPFPTHYLVLVVTDTDFRYALISVKIVPDSMFKVSSWRILGGLMWRGYVDVVARRGR
jgi:hypothetical protein